MSTYLDTFVDDFTVHPAWDNFRKYVEADVSGIGTAMEWTWMVEHELKNWNASPTIHNGAWVSYVKFDSEEDKTMFLLRFS